MPNINKKSQLEIDEKQVADRHAPELHYKTRALFSIHFPKVDKILTDKIFH